MYQFCKNNNKSRPRIEKRNVHWYRCSKGQTGKIHKSTHFYGPFNSISYEVIVTDEHKTECIRMSYSGTAYRAGKRDSWKY